MSIWKKKKKKRETSKFMDAGSYNRNERERITNMESVDREEWRRKIKSKL